MELDRINKVESLEEIGMADPFHTKKSLEESIEYCKTFDFFEGATNQEVLLLATLRYTFVNFIT